MNLPTTEKKKNRSPLEIVESFKSTDVVSKTVLIGAGALMVVFILGHTFSITAKAIRGYNDLRRALYGA